MKIARVLTLTLCLLYSVDSGQAIEKDELSSKKLSYLLSEIENRKAPVAKRRKNVAHLVEIIVQPGENRAMSRCGLLMFLGHSLRSDEKRDLIPALTKAKLVDFAQLEFSDSDESMQYAILGLLGGLAPFFEPAEATLMTFSEVPQCQRRTFLRASVIAGLDAAGRLDEVTKQQFLTTAMGKQSLLATIYCMNGKQLQDRHIKKIRALLGDNAKTDSLVKATAFYTLANAGALLQEDWRGIVEIILSRPNESGYVRPFSISEPSVTSHELALSIVNIHDNKIPEKYARRLVEGLSDVDATDVRFGITGPILLPLVIERLSSLLGGNQPGPSKFQ